MENIFNPNNKFWTIMGRLADLIILNLLFILCCIPIVTIGPALTAMHYVTMKMVRDEDSYIAKSFWKSFKENFRQALVIWLILFIAICMLLFDLYIFNNLPDGFSLPSFFKYILWIVGIILAMITLYVFPLLAKFENTIKRTLKNALIMSILHLPQTFLMLIILTAPFVLMLYGPEAVFNYGILVLTLFGFSGIAFINSTFLVKIFDKYIPKDEEAEEELLSDEALAEMAAEADKFSEQ